MLWTGSFELFQVLDNGIIIRMEQEMFISVSWTKIKILSLGTLPSDVEYFNRYDSYDILQVYD